MLRIAVGLVALVLAEVAIPAAWANASRNDSIVFGRSIAGIRPGMKLTDVRARLGPPDQIARAGPRFPRDAPVLRYHYFAQGLAVDFPRGKQYVWRVSTTSPRYNAPNGLRVGSTESVLRRRLAGEVCKLRSGHGYCVRDEEGHPTFFYFRCAKVSSIAIQIVKGDF